MDCEVTTGKASCPLATGYLYLLRRYNPPTNQLISASTSYCNRLAYFPEEQQSYNLVSPLYNIQYTVTRYTMQYKPGYIQVYLPGSSHLQALSHSATQ